METNASFYHRQGSEETPGVQGLGVIPTIVQKFDTTNVSVPHMVRDKMK